MDVVNFIWLANAEHRNRYELISHFRLNEGVDDHLVQVVGEILNHLSNSKGISFADLYIHLSHFSSGLADHYAQVFVFFTIGYPLYISPSKIVFVCIIPLFIRLISILRFSNSRLYNILSSSVLESAKNTISSA